MDGHVPDMNTIVKRNDVKYLANQLGEELIMMNMETGDFVAMNHVGAAIWKLTEQPATLKNLVEQLQNIYEISEEQCIRETVEFLQSTDAEKIFIFDNDIAA